MSSRKRRFPAHAAIAVALVLTVATTVTAIPGTAMAAGSYPNAAIADHALTRVGQVGGQCRAFVNNVVWVVSGNTQNISSGGDYFQSFLNAGGQEITNSSSLTRGDIVQVGQGIHTFIIVAYVGGATFNVVDSNHSYNEVVQNYNRTFSLGGNTRAFRMGTVGGTDANRDISGDRRADLAIVATGPTGSGRLEVHALNGATAYSTWLGNWATPAGYGNSADRYVMGDVNGDGRADLAIIATGPTGSGKLEAHILDGATGFSTWLAHWATAAGYGSSADRYAMGDINGDGRAELVVIATGPTGSGRMEVHALNASTGYSTWLGNWATPAGYGNSADRYVMGDVNGDGRADLTIIATGPTGSGRLEAHVLNGATSFSTWLGNWATTAGYGNSADRYVM